MGQAFVDSVCCYYINFYTLWTLWTQYDKWSWGLCHSFPRMGQPITFFWYAASCDLEWYGYIVCLNVLLLYLQRQSLPACYLCSPKWDIDISHQVFCFILPKQTGLAVSHFTELLHTSFTTSSYGCNGCNRIQIRTHIGLFRESHFKVSYDHHGCLCLGSLWPMRTQWPVTEPVPFDTGQFVLLQEAFMVLRLHCALLGLRTPCGRHNKATPKRSILSDTQHVWCSFLQKLNPSATEHRAWIGWGLCLICTKGHSPRTSTMEPIVVQIKMTNVGNRRWPTLTFELNLKVFRCFP